MASSEPHTFLKLEDLHNSSPPPASFDNSSTQQTPAPVIVQSKPAKKRKSWGQELPQPKTALPPRKRAKTDDEKEQRRIERIKRNRAAAHNSRERKRQETETLAVALARARAELAAYHDLHGPLPSHIVLPEVTLCTDDDDTPAASLVESRDSIDAPERPVSPHDTVFDFPVNIKEEETESSFPSTLPPALDNKSALDLTQHSAAMLCDLQCRSSRSMTPSTSWWTTLFLYLMTLQLQISYKTILMAIWTHSPPSLQARMTQASARRSISRSMTSSTTPLLSRSVLALAQLNAATGQVTPRQGAPALQRSSLVEAQRARIRAAAEQQHHSATSDTMALEESNGDCGSGDGEADGVGR